MTPRYLGCVLGGLVAAAAGGCDAGNESDLVGRTVTVEYRPIMTTNTSSLHKQRTGRVTAATTEWIAVREAASPNPIWIPRDMVLEVRVDK